VSLAARLWAANADLVQAARDTVFVRTLADGTLSAEAFAAYLAQDAFFLLSFARAYALALAASPDAATVLAFADLLAGVRDELRLHAAHGGGGTPVEAAPLTLAYTDFLLATAATAGLGATCAALTPCLRLYAHLGQELQTGEPDGPYAAWVATYADPAFAALATRLEALLDAHGEDTPAVRSAYRRAMGLEVAFFSAAAGGALDVPRPSAAPVVA